MGQRRLRFRLRSQAHLQHTFFREIIIFRPLPSLHSRKFRSLLPRVIATLRSLLPRNRDRSACTPLTASGDQVISVRRSVDAINIIAGSIYFNFRMYDGQGLDRVGVRGGGGINCNQGRAYFTEFTSLHPVPHF
jgi:hypothetical protein